MDGILRTWSHIFCGLGIVVIGILLVGGGATSLDWIDRKNDGAIERFFLGSGCHSEFCSQKSNLGWYVRRDADRDSETGKLPYNYIPPPYRVKNMAGKQDGLGLNAIACLENAANYQGVESLYGLTDRQSRKCGGCYPSKLDKMLREEQSDGRSFSYKQYDGQFLIERIETALGADKVPCASYKVGEKSRYGKEVLVSVHRRACILDPNWIDKLEWINRSEFEKRIGNWLVVLENTNKKPIREIDE